MQRLSGRRALVSLLALVACVSAVSASLTVHMDHGRLVRQAPPPPPATNPSDGKAPATTTTVPPAPIPATPNQQNSTNHTSSERVDPFDEPVLIPQKNKKSAEDLLPPPHVAVDAGDLDGDAYRLVRPTNPESVPLSTRSYPPYKTSPSQRILKSRSDRRQYRRLTLWNGLDVMLIRDRHTSRAAAAMDVGVGACNDPTDKSGLSHFLEHMLFMGSKKYPDMETYNEFIDAHGGFNNAYTSCDNTNYYFDVNSRSLYGALDIFADIFKNPSFNETAVMKELTAVESEHHKDLSSDGRRFWHLLHWLANEQHPFHKGGYVDLRAFQSTELRLALQNHFKMWYHAENMRLVIYGPQRLNTLERWARRLFTTLPRRAHAAPFRPAEFPVTDNSDTVFSSILSKNRTAIVRVRPLKHQRQLIITWPLPPQTHQYENKAVAYISSLLDQEGIGSLHSVLKRMGLATYVDSHRDGMVGFDMLRLHIALTKKGAKTWNIRKIIAYVYQYLHIIQKSGVERWRWRELGTIAAIRFRLKQKEAARSYVSYVASEMYKFKPEHALAGDFLFFSYDHKAINAILDRLVPSNALVTIIKKNQCCLDLNEPFYNTAYRQYYATDDENDLWTRSRNEEFEPKGDLALNLAMPPRNPFLPSTLEIKPKDGVHKFIEHPLIIKDIVDRESPSSGSQRLWFKQDAHFSKPYGVVNCKLWSNALYASPRSTVLATIYSAVVNDQLDEQLFQAEFAGFNWAFYNGKDGINFHIQGYDSNLEDVVLTMVSRMQPKISKSKPDYPAGFVVDSVRFETIKEELKMSYVNSIKHSSAHQYAAHGLALLLESPHWQFKEYVSAVDSITIEEFVAWAHGVFSDSALECLISGNLYRHEGMQMFDTIVSNLHFRSTSQALRTVSAQPQRVTQLDGAYIFRKYGAEEDPNNAVYHYYQAGFGNFFDDVCAELTALLIDQPAFSQLRTKEQLGYIVKAGQDRRHGVNAIYVMVQSASKPAWYLDKRIRRFLYKFRRSIQEMPSRAFKRLRKSLMYRKLGMPGTLFYEAAVHWEEISSQEYRFDRSFREMIAARFLTKKRFLAWMDKVFGFKSVPSLIALRVEAQRPAYNHTSLGALGGEGGHKSAATNAAPRSNYRPNNGKLPTNTVNMPPATVETRREAKHVLEMPREKPVMARATGDAKKALLAHSRLAANIAKSHKPTATATKASTPKSKSKHHAKIELDNFERKVMGVEPKVQQKAALKAAGAPKVVEAVKKMWHMPSPQYFDSTGDLAFLQIEEHMEAEGEHTQVVSCVVGAANNDPRCRCANPEFRAMNDNCNSFTIKALTPSQASQSFYAPGTHPGAKVQAGISSSERGVVYLKPNANQAANGKGVVMMSSSPSGAALQQEAKIQYIPKAQHQAAEQPATNTTTNVTTTPPPAAEAPAAAAEPAAPAAENVTVPAQPAPVLEPITKIIPVTQTIVKERTVHWLVEYACSKAGPRRYHHVTDISIESVRTFKANKCVYPKQRVGTVILPPFAVVKGYEHEDLQ